LKLEPWHLRDNAVVVYTDLTLLPVQSTPEQKTAKPKSKFGTVQYTAPKARPDVAMKIYVAESDAAFAADLEKAMAASNLDAGISHLAAKTDSAGANSSLDHAKLEHTDTVRPADASETAE